ncbi:hypothetical protein O8F89_001554, partial [Neisseria gonorrhoeae]
HTGRGRRLHLPPALRKRREGFLRAGFIFGSLYRFDRLKKRFSLMLKGGLYRVPGGVSIRNNKKAAIMV